LLKVFSLGQIGPIRCKGTGVIDQEAPLSMTIDNSTLLFQQSGGSDVMKYNVKLNRIKSKDLVILNSTKGSNDSIKFVIDHDVGFFTGTIKILHS